jgi:hypothetical protein
VTTTELDAQAGRVRTYGGWRRTRSMGLFGVGPIATVVVLGCVVLPVLVGAVSLRAGMVVAVPAALLAGLTLARLDGVPIGHLVHRRLRWTWGSARGYTSLRAGVVVEHPRAWQLPGPLAPTRLLSVDDGLGGRFGLVWDRRSGALTATLRCAAASTWLADGEDADGWVSNWHSWLASLGYVPMVRWVAVTVDTAPEPGTALHDHVLPRVNPGAPDDVRALMRELVARSPAAAADVDTRVSITFDPSASSQRLRELPEQLSEVGRLLAGLESALTTCGVTVLGRASERELAGVMRTAFDPVARGEVERAIGLAGEKELLSWAEAGPVGAEEAWDHYRHDSGISVSWGWHEAPRQQVTSGVLSRLLSPGRFSKRVTMLYRPLSAGDAARVLESQVNAAAFRDAYRRAQKRDETARDAADRLRAQRAAREEAEGAGVVLMSMYVTATVTDQDDLGEAVADIEARAEQSKIRLRRLYGSQAAGFATTLPAGMCPAQLSSRQFSR